MPEKNLPIQFFESRQVDDFRTEGGGPGKESKWLLPNELLIKKSEQLISELDAFVPIIADKEKKQSIIPFTFKAYMPEKATAKSKRQYVSKIFNTSQERSNLIGVLDKDELLIRISNVQELRTISARIREYETCKYGLSCLERITSFEPFVEKTDKHEKYKVHLLNFQNYEENLSILRLFEKVLYNNNLQFKKTCYTKSLPIYKIMANQSVILDTLKENDVFEALFSLEPMPKYAISLDASTIENTVPIMSPQADVNYATLGILDNGIAKIPHLDPWIAGSKSVYPSSSIAATHGTVVAGVALYGDSLEKSSWVGHNGIKIFDATVYPDTSRESIDEDELVENIREAVESSCDQIKIWNLSISITTPISENSFSDFGKFLDDIQEKCNVLICKSAGNCDNFKSGHPRGKIHQGADSVLALVVGSIAHAKGQYDISDIDNPSPFTRIGPGPEFIIKPEVVHYGGNAGIKLDGKITTTGIKSFSKDGSLAEFAGTSFATPRVAALATGIQQEINKEFDPLLIKALITHSTEYPDNLSIPYAERTKYVGFGKPPAITDILHNSPNEITLILRSTLVKGKYLDILDFPMPSCLLRDGFYTGQIIATLVYSPILDPTQGSEYCQSNIHVSLGTYDEKKKRDTTRRSILNPVGRDNSHNIFLPELYSKKSIKTGTDHFALRERLLIQYADKYYPVKKYAIDLADLTETNKKKCITANKHWYLLLDGLYRNFSEQQAVVQSQKLSQEFCLIITIRDPSTTMNVYDEAVQQLDANNFWHSQIELSNQINIRNHPAG
jgi:hypothetical protein